MACRLGLWKKIRRRKAGSMSNFCGKLLPTGATEQESTTYTRLRELRDALPCHTFLQYTATPQAPLLINIADILSPDFVHVLEPGEGYAGGAAFFAPGSPYIKVIP